MHTTRKLAAAGLAVGLLFTTAACGKVAEKVGEKAAEKAAGDGTKVDLGNGKVKVTDKDGNSYEADENGGKVHTSDGDTDYSTGDSTKLPDEWPSELDPPKGTKLTSAISSVNAASPGMSVTATIDGSPKDVYDGLKSQIQGADGYTIETDSFTSASGSDGGILSAKGPKWEVFASVNADPSGGGSIISLTLSKPSS